MSKYSPWWWRVLPLWIREWPVRPYRWWTSPVIALKLRAMGMPRKEK